MYSTHAHAIICSAQMKQHTRNSLNSVNSGNLIIHWSMNWSHFKDRVSHMCLAGTVVAFWSLTQEVADSNPFILMTNILVKTQRSNAGC